MLEELKQKVLVSNQLLQSMNLVTFTWGNVSAIDRKLGYVVIKPSGVEYDNMTIDDLVVLDLQGNIIEGKNHPSTDTPTHLYLYAKYPMLGGITHTHSVYATTWAQAGAPIPVLGTTHADNFYGPIPCARMLTAQEIAEDYEHYTGVAIGETFDQLQLTPETMPAILCSNHGPFTFGATALESVKTAKVLETVAQMAWQTYSINGSLNSVRSELIDKHYFRKHGNKAYYGQAQNK